MAGRPITWGSTAVRPKASGSSDGAMAMIGQQIGGRHVVAVSDQPDRVLQAGGGDGGGQLGAIALAALVVASQQQQDLVLAARLQQGHGLDHQGLAFPAGQATGQQHLQATLARRDAPGLAQSLDAVGADDAGLEARQVDAARGSPRPSRARRRAPG
jgi:hypothetical protein